jgi:anti-sigma regulatory factor (Ser/Thr protein kinase)
MLSLTLSLGNDVGAPARARTMIRGLTPLFGEERTEDATLLVSELVTNAVKYGTGPVELRVEAQDGKPRFTISDAGGGDEPLMRETGGERSGGYGLQLVDRIADDWGVVHASMHVWFELG